MSDSFSVRSSLTISTNIETVLTNLIEEFETLDKRIKGSQEVLASFAKSGGNAGKEGSALAKAFAELKVPGNLVSEITKVAEVGKNIAGSAREAAASWRQMAESSRVLQNARLPSGGLDGGSRGGLRSQIAEDHGSIQSGERKKFDDDYFLAMRENLAKDLASAQSERDATRRFNESYRVTMRENMGKDAADAARERAANKKFSDDFAPAINRKNRDHDTTAASNAPKHRREHDLVTGGMGFEAGGDKTLSFGEEAVKTAFDYEQKFSMLTSDTRVGEAPGDTPLDTKAKEARLDDLRRTIREVSRAVPGSTQEGTLEIFNDMKTAFGTFEEAKEMLKPFTELVTTLQMTDVGKGGAGDMKQALNLARFIEDQGGAIDLKNPEHYDPATFARLAQRAVGVYMGTGGRVSPREMLTFQKSGRTAGMMMNEHALYEETPYFAGALGASRVGTAVFSDAQVMLANKMTDKTSNALGEIGLYDRKRFVPGKPGKPGKMVWDQESLKGKDELATDPYKWIHDILGGSVASSLKVDPTTKEGQQAVMVKLTELAQRGTIAGLWADVYRGYGPAQKEGKNIASQNPDMQKHFQETNPMAQMMAYRAAQNEMMLTFGELLKGPALDALKSLTGALREFSDWTDAHKEEAAIFSRWAAEIAIGAKVLGGVTVGAMFLAPMASLTRSLLTLGGVVGPVASSLIPFAEGGAARMALTGLASGLSTLSIGLGTAYLALKSTATSSQKSEDVIIGKPNADPHRFDAFDRPAAHQDDPNKSGFMNYIDKLFDPKSYYGGSKRSPEAIVSKPEASTGSASNPTHVIVQNQISEAGISRGVASNIASKSNRPQSGYTGTDDRMDPFGSFAGMVNN